MNICIIKLGAPGDVLRTVPLAKAIYQTYPQAHVTWITQGDVATLLEGLSYIHEIIDITTQEIAEGRIFDALYTLDTETEAMALAEKLQASKRYGFYLEGTYPAAHNAGGEYYLSTMFDDELKKSNKKTYQEIMFDIAELPYKKERCSLVLNEDDRWFADQFLETNLLHDDRIIGIHMGASSRWPSKIWHEDCVKEFIRLAEKKEYAVIMFGGPNECERHARLVAELKEESITVYQNNPLNSKREFAALVSVCDFIVCGDSFSLHVALGLGVKTVALFFITSPAEVETYDLGTKLVARRLYELFPERSDEYHEELVKSISAEEVMKVIEKQ